jgi:sugar phosphate isomerase/epimerase
MTVKVACIPNDFYHGSRGFEQVLDEVCAPLGVKYIEIAYLWGKSILDLDETEIAKLHESLDQRDIRIGSIQTQIMKVIPNGALLASPGSKNMARDQAFNTSRIDDAIRCAKEFGTKLIVTYSYFSSTMKKKQVEPFWDMLFQDYNGLVEKCQAEDCTMVVECEDDTLVHDTKTYLRLFDYFNSPHLAANLDLANFISYANVFTEEDFTQLKDHVAYFHCKDRILSKGIMSKGILRRIFHGKGAVFCTGDVPWKQVLPWFVDAGFDGILSVEPHVHGANQFEDAKQCVAGLQKLLGELNIEYE